MLRYRCEVHPTHKSESKYLKNRRAAKSPPQRRPLMNNENPSQDIGYNIDIATLAKHVFTNKYKKRPKSSLRMSMAKFKFPSAIAVVHLRAYGKRSDAARTIPTIFRVTTNVNSFLVSQTGSKIRNTASRPDNRTPTCMC